MGVVLANSRFTMDRLRVIYGPDLRVRPCIPGIPSPEHPPIAGRLGADVLSLGRLLPSKNIDTVLHAVRLLVNRGQHVRLRIAGAGPHGDALRALARRLGLDEHVTFLGELRRHDELAAAFVSARVLAFMSFDEPLGLVPLEAGLWGVPSVVSNHGGPAETVVDGVTGIHADPSSPESVADGLARLLNDEDLAMRLGEAMRREVLNEYTVARFADRFEAEVSSVLGRTSRKATMVAGQS
jgi:glycosyltransferase involved in cell wall biosynthesis